DSIESRPVPIALENNVLVTSHDERARVVLRRIGGRGFERFAIQRFQLWSNPRRGRLVAAGDPLPGLIEREARTGVSRHREEIALPENGLTHEYERDEHDEPDRTEQDGDAQRLH